MSSLSGTRSPISWHSLRHNTQRSGWFIIHHQWKITSFLYESNTRRYITTFSTYLTSNNSRLRYHWPLYLLNSILLPYVIIQKSNMNVCYARVFVFDAYTGDFTSSSNRVDGFLKAHVLHNILLLCYLEMKAWLGQYGRVSLLIVYLTIRYVDLTPTQFKPLSKAVNRLRFRWIK